MQEAREAIERLVALSREAQGMLLGETQLQARLREYAPLYKQVRADPTARCCILSLCPGQHCACV